MKKKISILGLLLVFAFSFTSIYASTTTYTRSESNLASELKPEIKITEKVVKAAMSTPKVNAKEKVYDFGNLIDDSKEQQLYSAISEYISKYNFDMAVVTIDDNNKKSAMEYADDFYDYNDFGIGTDYSGILFLIDMDNRKMWISTTGKAIKMYTDYRIDKILDETYVQIKKENYYKTAKAFIDEAAKWAEKGYPTANEASDVQFSFFPTLIFSGVFALIFMLIFIGINKKKHTTIAKATEAKEYLVKNSFVVTNQNNVFLRTRTIKTYCPPSSSSGGGSSTHSGSSGFSHGGGGRSF